MTADIDAVLADLDASLDEGRVNTPVKGFSSERLRTLTGIIADRINEMISANAREFRLPAAPDTAAGSLDNLRRHLELQRRIKRYRVGKRRPP